MMLIRNKDHNDVGLLGGVGGSHDAQPIRLCFLTALAAAGKTDHYIAAVIMQIKGVGMPLTSIANNCDAFLLNKLQICICIIIDMCHCCLLPFKMYSNIFDFCIAPSDVPQRHYDLEKRYSTPHSRGECV